MLVRMVCEAVSGCMFNVQIYAAEVKKLDSIILSLIDRSFSQDYLNYEDNFENSEMS
jgi:hypothetical protein